MNEHTRNRLAQGVSAVHILSDFIKNDHEEQVLGADAHTPDGNGIDTKSHVVESALTEYDGHFYEDNGSIQPSHIHWADEVDQEWFTNNLSLSLSTDLQNQKN